MLRIIGIITFTVIFSSCTNKADSVLAVFKATEEGLIQSNSVISNSSNVVQIRPLIRQMAPFVRLS